MNVHNLFRRLTPPAEITDPAAFAQLMEDLYGTPDRLSADRRRTPDRRVAPKTPNAPRWVGGEWREPSRDF